MKRMLLLAPALLAWASPAAAQWAASVPAAGAKLSRTVFDPDRLFAGDIRESSDDQVIMTVAASAIEDYYPAYSLAIAYRCADDGCGYQVRMLRVARIPGSGEPSIALARSIVRARSNEQARRILDASHLEWVETDLAKCDGALSAFDAARKADWTPDLHQMMAQNPDIIIDPAQIHVTISGLTTRTSYSGWVLAPGVPLAVVHMVEVLDKCWQPSQATPPWRRLAKRR